MKRLVFIILFLALLPIIYLLFIPDISTLKKENPKKTAFMEYREREWKEKGGKFKIKQIWIPLAKVSPFLIKAVIIAEDDKFWKHEGFDYDTLEKAIEKDIEAHYCPNVI